jgi:hypothetical protein
MEREAITTYSNTYNKILKLKEDSTNINKLA